jgi:hypothetical protein
MRNLPAAAVAARAKGRSWRVATASRSSSCSLSITTTAGSLGQGVHRGRKSGRCSPAHTASAPYDCPADADLLPPPGWYGGAGAAARLDHHLLAAVREQQVGRRPDR